VVSYIFLGRSLGLFQGSVSGHLSSYLLTLSASYSPGLITDEDRNGENLIVIRTF
jgi:hypothetical protein